MTTQIRSAIAAAAIAALFAPAGFAQTTKGEQQDARAKCEKLVGMDRLDCLDKLRAEGKLPPTGGPSEGPRPAPTPSSPSGPR